MRGRGSTLKLAMAPHIHKMLCEAHRLGKRGTVNPQVKSTAAVHIEKPGVKSPCPAHSLLDVHKARGITLPHCVITIKLRY